MADCRGWLNVSSQTVCISMQTNSMNPLQDSCAPEKHVESRLRANGRDVQRPRPGPEE
jgi:hypothetical protein